MVILTPSVEFYTLDEAAVRERLSSILIDKSVNEQKGILDGLVTRMETHSSLSYDLARGQVSGSIKVEVPDDWAQRIEDDALTEESFLVNTAEETASEFNDKLAKEIVALGGN
jgi:hypothetical protein